jgi:hypothetical protein
MAGKRHHLFLRVPRAMDSEPAQPVTELLRAAQAGDAAAADRLMAGPRRRVRCAGVVRPAPSPTGTRKGGQRKTLQQAVRRS